MKTKIDIYTKIVLTVIAVALVGILVKDIDFVSKAHANELDLSAMKIENVSDEEGTTFYIYDNDLISGPFGKDKYITDKYKYSSPTMRSKDERRAYINGKYDIPKYIITSKTGAFWLDK